MRHGSRRLLEWFGRTVREVALVRELRPVFATRGSWMKATALAVVMLPKGRSPWRDTPVALWVYFAGRKVQIFVTGPTEFGVLREIALEEEYRLPSFLTPPETIVDLGAHVGFSSLYFAVLAPQAQIVSVEANPALIPRLERNLKGTQAQVVHAAVTDRSGEVSFFRHSESWSSSLERRHAWQEEVTVPAWTLSDLRDRMGIDKIDLLKLDVEGAEWEILRTGYPSGVGLIMGEIHARPAHPPQDLVRDLRETCDVQIVRESASFIVFRAKELGQ